MIKEGQSDARQWPFGLYEYVDVTFGPAHTDTTIPYTRLRTDNKESIRWMDVTPGGLFVGDDPDPLAPSPAARVYRVRTGGQATPFGRNYIVLRCDQPSYTTRLMLWVERVEASSA